MAPIRMTVKKPPREAPPACVPSPVGRVGRRHRCHRTESKFQNIFSFHCGENDPNRHILTENRIFALTLKKSGSFAVTEEEARALISSVCDGWYTAILRYAWRLCGSMEMAEDLVQDALLQLYAELRSGHFIGNPRAWGVIVVRRQAAKQSAARRQQARHTV